MKVRFKNIVFGETSPYYPHYEKYYGLTFETGKQPYKGHVFLTCIDDPSVTVDGAIHMEELEEIC